MIEVVAKIDREQARRLSENGRAALQQMAEQRRAAGAEAAQLTREDVMTWLKVYCQAWADLQSLQVDSVRLPHLSIRRDIDYTREQLRALEQQIALLQSALTDDVPEKATRRIWA